jgi:hypothetical protein
VRALLPFLPAASALFATPALAESPAAFTAIDGSGDGSCVRADVAVSFGDGATFARSTILGQYIGAAGIGGYASIAATLAVADDSDRSFESLGNLQLGAIVQRSIGPELDVAVRAGLVLPTATAQEFDGVAQTMATRAARPSDVVTTYPEATWLRLGVAPTFHRGAFYARADAGVDVAILGADGVGVGAVGHVDLGVGLRKGRLSATAELQNMIELGIDRDDDTSLAERSVHTAGVSLRYHAPWVEPFVALSSPLDDGRRGALVTITAGVAAPL